MMWFALALLVCTLLCVSVFAHQTHKDAEADRLELNSQRELNNALAQQLNIAHRHIGQLEERLMRKQASDRNPQNIATAVMERMDWLKSLNTRNEPPENFDSPFDQ